MTHVADGVLVVCAEAAQQCDDCGRVDELRPYGPGGSKICHPCGQKDPEGTARRLYAYLRLNQIERFCIVLEDDDR